jgi:hypothetical protein
MRTVDCDEGDCDDGDDDDDDDDEDEDEDEDDDDDDWSGGRSRRRGAKGVMCDLWHERKKRTWGCWDGVEGSNCELL